MATPDTAIPTQNERLPAREVVVQVAMDPHKAPPQALKNIFKELRSIKDKDDPRIAAHLILDLSIDQVTESARRVHVFDKTFDYFHSETQVTHPAIPGNPLSPSCFFTASGVPGRKFQFNFAIDDI
jgi:hypothetical protein